MKITFEELLKDKTWLHSEILNSLDDETVLNATKDGYYDVKLLINGREFEPKLFNKILNNIEKCVELEGKKLIDDKLQEADLKARKLEELVQEAADKIREAFDILNEE